MSTFNPRDLIGNKKLLEEVLKNYEEQLNDLERLIAEAHLKNPQLNSITLDSARRAVTKLQSVIQDLRDIMQITTKQ